MGPSYNDLVTCIVVSFSVIEAFLIKTIFDIILFNIKVPEYKFQKFMYLLLHKPA